MKKLKSALRRLFYFQAVIIFATSHSSRLKWVAQWLGVRLLGHGLEVCCDAAALPKDAIVLNYSNLPLAVPHYQIVPHGLLHAAGVVPQQPEVLRYKGMPVWYATTGGHHVFDVLAASFFLLSRYEEYAEAFEPDEYQRYSHTNSMAWRHGFLHRPIVDEWIEDLKTCLLATFPNLVWKPNEFRFIPTYDVDVAWSMQHKGWWRNAGGLCKELLSAQWQQATTRCKVWLGLQPDPHDIFDDLQQQHSHYSLQPIYFFLVAKAYKGYDRNINRNKTAYRQLMRHMQQQCPAGLHASWAASGHIEVLKDEQQYLQQLWQAPVVRNRMHYINFRLPETFRQLAGLGIAEEYSMGYGTVNGFRAGTAHPYTWYNLTAEEMLPLQIFPFVWMDANSIFEHKHTTDQALAQLQALFDTTQKTGGVFVTIAHNHLMGNDQAGKPWQQLYFQFLQRNFS